MNRSVVVAIASAVLCLLSPTAGPAQSLMDGSMFGLRNGVAPSQPSLVFTDRGWRIDASAARRVQSPAKTVAAIHAQIGLVERMRLKPEVLAFMRAVPVTADASSGVEAATYAPGHGVGLRVRRLNAKRPVLLYGLLQAYYDQRLAAMPAGRDIDGFRRQIIARRAWPKAALMLQNNQQFFGLTATAYLYGTITREPYTRGDLKKTGPQYYQWLALLFDDGKPRG